MATNMVAPPQTTSAGFARPNRVKVNKRVLELREK